MYDFHKLRHKDKSKEFKHAYFQRGKYELLAHIQRKTNESSLVEDNLLAKFNELQAQQKLLKEQNARLLEQKNKALLELEQKEDPKLSLLERAKEVYLKSKTEKLSQEEKCIFDLTSKFVQDMQTLEPDNFFLSTGTKSTSEGETYPSSIGQADQDDNTSQISDLGKRAFMPWEYEFNEYAGLSQPRKAAFNSDLFGELNHEADLNYADNDIQFQFNLEQDFSTF